MRQFSEPDADAEYLVVFTYLPVKRLLRLPRFLGYVRKIQRQLDAAPAGLAGYSLLAKPHRSRYWTLSAWADAVVDVEATCWEGGPPAGQVSEIVEIGLAIVDLAAGRRIGRQRILVRPERSAVSPLCTELTGLTQAEVGGCHRSRSALIRPDATAPVRESWSRSFWPA